MVKRTKRYKTPTIYLDNFPAGVSVTKEVTPQKLDFKAQAKIDEYLALKKKNNKIVVCSAIVGGYDTLQVPEHLNPNFDYVCFSDISISGYGIWEIRPIDYYHTNPSKVARYIKTHPFRFFKGKYDTSIWVDGNILIRGDLEKYVHALNDSGYVFGAITHPHRSCTYQEADTCKELKKDDALNIGRQIRKYRQAGFKKDLGLVETGVLVSDLKSQELKEAYKLWWNEIRDHSHRDQLSIMYAFSEAEVGILRLLRPGKSVRNHPDFSHFQHGKRSKYRRPEVKIPAREKPIFFHEVREKKLLELPDVKVDIVICVHNALSDFKRLVKSLKPALTNNVRVVIVNDGSGADTTKYIEHYAKNREDKIKVIHNPVALKYTRAANQGLKLPGADVKLLVNSDVIFPAQAVEKLVLALYSEESLAVVGPLSNAAGKQSVPSIKNMRDNTAINTLPKNLTIQNIDTFLEQWAVVDFYPRIPLVHGFCIAFKTKVLESVGYFDEAAFPRGYGEENDLCFRIADAGHDLAVAVNTFVYHAKSKSYSDATSRQQLMRSGIEKLREMYGTRVDDASEQMKHHPELDRIRGEANRLWRKRNSKNIRTKRRR